MRKYISDEGEYLKKTISLQINKKETYKTCTYFKSCMRKTLILSRFKDTLLFFFSVAKQLLVRLGIP